MVNGGSGLARYQGRVVFIPHTAVGDLVRVRLVQVKKQYAEAQIVELLQSGPARCLPRCPVAGDCGGCQWQHLPYTEQLVWKERLFKETLSRLLSVEESLFCPIIPSPEEWSYRSRVQVKCYNGEAGFVTGFYRPRSHFVVSIDHCPIMDPRLNELLSSLKHIISGSEYAGFIPQIDLSVDDSGKRAAVIHYLGSQPVTLVKLLQSSKLEADLQVQFGTKKNLTMVQGDGFMHLKVDVPQLSLSYAIGSFAQINLAQNRALIAAVVAIFPWQKTHNVLELFCGMGNFSFPIARRVNHLTAVEESGLSVRMARKNALQTGIDNLEFCECTAEEALQQIEINQNYDVVVLDPPRTGAYAVMKCLLGADVPNIIYISCDPQTLARDLGVLLQGGYRIIRSQPLDMFPQTFHCESVTHVQKISD